MTSRNGGTVGRFVAQRSFPWRDDFGGLTPGSAQFSRVWRALARNQPEAFFAAQHAYIKRTHFDKLVTKIEREKQLDITRRSAALMDVIWSTAVQNAIETLRAEGLYKPRSPKFDHNLIIAIYAERGRRTASGSLVYFSRNSPAVQRGVASRFMNEEQDALRMLDGE